MSNDYFKFKKFTIWHGECAMKVGTDGVLIGAWADGGMRTLDVGTGTGLIALMTSQRCPSAHVDGIEIDERAAAQAVSNVERSLYRDNVNIIHTSLQDYTNSCVDAGMFYDVIISNPPFFTETTQCPEEKRHIARHTDSLTYKDLLSCSYKLLHSDGVLYIIVPYESKEKILYETCVANMYVKKICYVKTTPRKNVRRIMLALSKTFTEEITTEEHCLMNADGTKSDWYKKLTEDYYL